jgi:hypothetical protein
VSVVIVKYPIKLWQPKTFCIFAAYLQISIVGDPWFCWHSFAAVWSHRCSSQWGSHLPKLWQRRLRRLGSLRGRCLQQSFWEGWRLPLLWYGNSLCIHCAGLLLQFTLIFFYYLCQGIHMATYACTINRITEVQRTILPLLAGLQMDFFSTVDIPQVLS